MLINLVYLVIFLILVFVIYIAVKAINTGMQAKNSNKLEDNIKKTDFIDGENESISSGKTCYRLQRKSTCKTGQQRSGFNQCENVDKPILRNCC